MAEASSEVPQIATASSVDAPETTVAPSTAAPAADATTAVPPTTENTPSVAKGRFRPLCAAYMSFAETCLNVVDTSVADNATAAATAAPADDQPTAATEGDGSKTTEAATSMSIHLATDIIEVTDMFFEGVVAAEPTGLATNGTPSTGKKDNKKRKSGAADGKKTPSKKKPGKEMHLDVQPGQLWWVKTKGYPNWPGIICDEEMLPATLLEKRPVSAIRLDGTYRQDFDDGGKNVRDRRYAVMYLGSNEL